MKVREKIQNVEFRVVQKITILNKNQNKTYLSLKVHKVAFFIMFILNFTARMFNFFSDVKSSVTNAFFLNSSIIQLRHLISLIFVMINALNM